MSRDAWLTTLSVEGVGIELGVGTGVFSKAICDYTKLSVVYGIDQYSDHHDEQEMQSMKTLLSKEIKENRYKFLRGKFCDLVNGFSDETFNFIYIDGYAHTGQEQGSTLVEWWPKLKRGGIFSGHDYHPRYARTVSAVNDFINKHSLKLNIVNEQVSRAMSIYPSWWCVK